MGIKLILENYDVLFFLAAICCVSLIMKMISAALYRKLLWDSNQMGATDNRLMKSMMSKFEAYYKLQISVHNVENFVDRYLYHYHFMGLSLRSWEYIGCYFMAVTVGFAALFCTAAGYFGLPFRWFCVMGFTVTVLLLVQGIFELAFNMRSSWRILRIQVIDYMENTMRARLENEYFHQDAVREYQREYFEEPQETEGGEKSAEEKTADSFEAEARREAPDSISADNPKLQELLTTLLEEAQIDRDIARRRQAMSDHTALERAELFEEVLREYI